MRCDGDPSYIFSLKKVALLWWLSNIWWVHIIIMRVHHMMHVHHMMRVHHIMCVHHMMHVHRHEICQKIYTTGFFWRKMYTLNVRKLRLFLLKKKQQKCINVRNLSNFLVKIPLSEKNFNGFSMKSLMLCVNLVLLRKFCMKSRCFLEKFTQIAKILHDRRSWRSRQISTLCTVRVKQSHLKSSLLRRHSLEPAWPMARQNLCKF